MRTILYRDRNYLQRKLLLEKARVLHRGAPVHLLCRLYRLSTSTVSRWLNYGLLPRRRAARARLASLLHITDTELEATRSTLKEVNHDFQSEFECSHR